MAACPACTFINADDATACEMCGASLETTLPAAAALAYTFAVAAVVKRSGDGRRCIAAEVCATCTALVRSGKALWQAWSLQRRESDVLEGNFGVCTTINFLLMISILTVLCMVENQNIVFQAAVCVHACKVCLLTDIKIRQTDSYSTQSFPS